MSPTSDSLRDGAQLSEKREKPAEGLATRLHKRAQKKRENANSLRITLRHSLTGDKICLPGIATLENGWTVHGDYPVDDLLKHGGMLVFKVGQDGNVNDNAEQFRVSAVLTSTGTWPAPRSFLLFECASDTNEVDLVFGQQRLCLFDEETSLAAAVQQSALFRSRCPLVRAAIDDGATVPAKSLQRRCFICTRRICSGIRSLVHNDCPHFACSLQHLFAMEQEWITLKLEMLASDEAWVTQPPSKRFRSTRPASLNSAV